MKVSSFYLFFNRQLRERQTDRKALYYLAQKQEETKVEGSVSLRLYIWRIKQECKK